MHLYYFVILIFLLLPFNSKCLKNLTQRQFKNERQAIALIRGENNLYRLARPELIDDQLKFPIEKGESIQYFCTHGIVHSTREEHYQFHDCGHPPNIVLRTSSADDKLTEMWPGKVIYQIGYELMDETNSQAKDDTNLNIVDETDSQATDKTNFKCSIKHLLNFIPSNKKNAKPEAKAEVEPDPIQPPTKPNGPFVPLVQFVYDADMSLPIFVKYDITSAQSLAIETSYMLDYNKLNPKTGGEMDMDKFYKIDMTEKLIPFSHPAASPNNKPHLSVTDLYAIKKQLVPHDDLLLFSWKPAAFYDALTAPIWNVLKIKWELVEQFIRRLANVLGALEVYTGVRQSPIYIGGEKILGTIEIQDEENHTTLSVPSHFWKAIIHRRSNLGVLIVMNNLFSLERDNLCYDINFKNYWPFINEDMRSGTIYVCELNNENMKKVLSDYPNFNVNQMELDDLQSNIPLDVWKDIIHNIY